MAALYAVADRTGSPSDSRTLDVDEDLYFVIEQSLGLQAAGEPMGGRRQRIGRDVARVDWTRFYDLVVTLWPEFLEHNVHQLYRDAINRILGAYDVAWDLGLDGHLHRILPEPVAVQVVAVFAELADPRYSAALALVTAALDAYDERPRRDRDACVNVFAAVESVAQVKFGMPNARLDNVLTELRRRSTFNVSVVEMLDKVNVLRHRTFGHGTAQAFSLSGTETDFTYLTCMAAILLFARS
ncbi:MAG: hypothetical protein ABSE64_16615 [Vulcanimicrobiaceae bacterium]